MVDNEQNLHRLKSLIDRLGDQWNVDEPTNPDKYERTEQLIVFLYNMAPDWPSFYGLLREAQKEIDDVLTTEEQ